MSRILYTYINQSIHAYVRVVYFYFFLRPFVARQRPVPCTQRRTAQRCCFYVRSFDYDHYARIILSFVACIAYGGYLIYTVCIHSVYRIIIRVYPWSCMCEMCALSYNILYRCMYVEKMNNISNRVLEFGARRERTRYSRHKIRVHDGRVTMV